MPANFGTKSVILRGCVAAMKSPSTNVLDGSATPSSASPGAAVKPHTDPDPFIISDVEMAWLFVDAAESCLTGYERTRIFVELGCGEHYLAIEHILTAVASSRMALPAPVLVALTDWLHGYAGSPAQEQLRRILADIRPQQFGAVSVQAHAAIGGEGQASRCTHPALTATGSATAMANRSTIRSAPCAQAGASAEEAALHIVSDEHTDER